MPPRVIVEAPTVARSPAESRSAHFHAKVAALEVQEAQQGGRLVGGDRRFRAALFVDVGHGRGR